MTDKQLTVPVSFRLPAELVDRIEDYHVYWTAEMKKKHVDITKTDTIKKILEIGLIELEQRKRKKK